MKLLRTILVVLLILSVGSPTYADLAVGNGSPSAYFTGAVTSGNVVCAGVTTNTLTTSGCSASSLVTSVTGTSPITSSPTTGSVVVGCATCVVLSPGSAQTGSINVTANIKAGTYLQAGAVTVSTTTGDGSFSRSATTGAVFLGGGTHDGELDYGIGNANAFTLSADVGANTDLYLNSNAVGKLHAGQVIVSGNAVPGLIISGSAATTPHEEIGQKTATVTALCPTSTACTISGNSITFTTTFSSAPICMYVVGDSATRAVAQDVGSTTTTGTFVLSSVAAAIAGGTTVVVNYDCKGNT